ncbi:galactonate dehydratase (plasmid) [Skermanella rosea]|uniref:galactonate dehydratase n=1 Tax=Skermanella rosea TaxID=1817965 RepID=UPI0019320DF3|nr:galactonate dehydratase [Skermanella rosea]UEM07525.1 galactonate dehydratase [Skermanella rosea]
MKIIDVTTTVVNAEMRNWVFVKIATDQGLHGWGEATLEWKTRAVVGAIEDLKPILLGRDPRDIRQNVRALVKHGFWKVGAIGMTAISGLEHAMWDIFGKSAGLPVWRLLGGRVRDRVRIYTHLGLGDMRAVYGALEADRLAESAASLVALGYTAFKVVLSPYTHHTATGEGLRLVETTMAALRRTVGDDVEIMLDFHGRPASAKAALQYVRAVEPFRPMFVEEPIQPGDVQSLAEIRRAAACPIATGERLIGHDEFEPVIAARAVDIVQPDLNHCGGLLEAQAIAAAASVAGIGVAPHNPNGPIAAAAALHFAVATPNHVIQEVMDKSVPWYDEVLVRTPVRREGAWWLVPDAPGLGIEVDEEAAARHPFEQEVFASLEAVMDDGTIVDW